MFTEDALKGRLHWLLDLSWAGVQVHLAGHEVTATVEGEEHVYRPGLIWPRSVSQGMSPFRTDGGGLQVSLTMLLWQAAEVDVPALVADGHHPGSAVGTLRLYSETTDEVVDVLVGRLRAPQWGATVVPLVAILEELPYADDTAELWGPYQRVLASTWPTPAQNASGERYPIVVGSPGGYSTGEFYGSPGLLVNDTPGSETVLIAGHHTAAAEAGAQVEYYNATTGAAPVYFVPSNSNDGRGRPVCTIDASTLGAAAPNDGDELWISWNTSAGVRTYGLQDGTSSGDPIRGLGDVLVWALRKSRVRWDAGRVAAVQQRLNTMLVDTYILTAPTSNLSPYQWVQELLADLPVSLQTGPHGLFFGLWEPFTAPGDALVHLDATRGTGNAQRTGLVQLSERDDVRTTVSVSYRRSSVNGSLKLQHVLSGDPAELEESGTKRELRLLQAYDQYGPSGTASVELTWAEDEPSADVVARALAAYHGGQRVRVPYLVDQWPGGRVWPGDAVTVTDGELGWTARMGMVLDAQWTEDAGRELVVEFLV